MSISLRRASISLAMSLAMSTVAVIGIAGPVHAADSPPKATISLDVKTVGKFGPIITDGKGLTMYMFSPDRPNVSNCEGACLNVWPPVMLGKGETLANVELSGGLRRSKLGVATRFDGSQQVTYNGWALYYWVQDKVAGDVKGQWVGNVWFVMDPTGQPNTDRA